MSNAEYIKTMEDMRNIIDIKFASNKKILFKRDIKTKYMSQKLFDNNLVSIQKSKITLKLRKSAHAGMCILDLNKVLMHEFHYDYL